MKDYKDIDICIFGGPLNIEGLVEGGWPWGPGKVVYNLKRGLEKLNIVYKESEESEYNVVINGSASYLDFRSITPSNKKTLIGPCIELFPFEDPFLNENYTNYIAASDWHAELFRGCKEDRSKNKKIFSWPAGIDTEYYCDNSQDKEFDFTLCIKHRDQRDVDLMLNILTKFNQKENPQRLIHGNYKNEDLLKAANTSKYIVILTGSETQGIGNMEMMSANAPLFVLDRNCHHALGSLHSPFEASSVPFFTEECGVKLHEKDYTEDYEPSPDPFCDRLKPEVKAAQPKDVYVFDDYLVCKQPTLGSILKEDYITHRFEEFLKNLNNYNPRDYILRNHTLEKSAINLLNIFNEL